jgi:hypothetical protein
MKRPKRKRRIFPTKRDAPIVVFYSMVSISPILLVVILMAFKVIEVDTVTKAIGFLLLFFSVFLYLLFLFRIEYEITSTELIIISTFRRERISLLALGDVYIYPRFNLFAVGYALSNDCLEIHMRTRASMTQDQIVYISPDDKEGFISALEMARINLTLPEAPKSIKYGRPL